MTSKHIIPIDPDNPVIPVQYTDAQGEEEDPIKVMLLSKNQQLDINMVAKKGIGKTHAKWSPVSTCIMRKQPLVALDYDTVNRQLTMEQKQTFVSKCPRKVFKLNNFKQAVEIENADNCSLCLECTKYGKEVGLPLKAVVIGENDAKFIFTVEGTGALPPEDIVLRAVKILQGKLAFLAEGMQ